MINLECHVYLGLRCPGAAGALGRGIRLLTGQRSELTSPPAVLEEGSQMLHLEAV